MKRTALLSSFLPPASTVGSIILSRLFDNFTPQECCYITQQSINRPTNNTLPVLNGKYIYYYPEKKIKLIRYLSTLINWLNLLRELQSRRKQIRKILVREKVKNLIICSGDVLNLPAGWLAARKLGIKIYPYLFDDYVNQWKASLRYRYWFARFFGQIFLKRVEKFIVPNEFMAREYYQRYHVSSVIIYNCTPIPKLKDLDQTSKKFFDQSYFNIVFTGTISYAQYDAFENLFKAVNQSRLKNIKVHIYSGQSRRDLKPLRPLPDYFELHQSLSNREIFPLQRQADLLFLPLAFKSPFPKVIKTSSPGKMGEYLAVGRPILVHAPADSFVSSYFKKNHCGVVVDQKDPQLLKKAILQLISDAKLRDKISQNARRCAEEDFDVKKVKVKFKKIFE